MGSLEEKLKTSRWIQGKTVLWLFIITNLIYVFMLTVTIPKVMGFAGGMKLMDMLPSGYDFQYVNVLLNKLGEEGRALYMYRQIPADMIYPALFGISYSVLLLYFFKKLNKLNSGLVYLSILPPIGGLFDYMENIGIIFMLKRFPDLTTDLVSMTNVFTIVKSFLTSVYFIVLLVTLGVWVFQLLKKK
jgi:hypothetical protein